MQAYFMRHAHTNFNEQNLCNDNPLTDVHLTQTGIQQARQAAGKLRDCKLELIVVSELPRTRQTAEIINDDHHAPIAVNPTLNDIRTGFDGRSVDAYFEAVADDPLHKSVNGGESLLQYKQRVSPYLDWLRQQPYTTTLTIAHEETLRVIYAMLHQVPDNQLRSLHFRNCAFFHANI